MIAYHTLCSVPCSISGLQEVNEINKAIRNDGINPMVS